jgi:putative acyl-CoA dehydrogenase
MLTHTVVNQVPPRVDVNEFATHAALVDAVRHYDAGWALGELQGIGALVGTEEFQRDAETANTNVPTLATHDRYGNRIDEVRYDSAYHAVIAQAVTHGAHTGAWADPKPGANVARAAAFMLFAQIEPGHACPVSMTHSAVPVLQKQPELAERWLPRLYSRDYDDSFSAGKTSALIGMAMTEKQGGSDVRANTTRAVRRSGSEYFLTGHKWFCSAPMSDAFLVLAQVSAGDRDALSCFLVPRMLEDGTRNVFRIQRLRTSSATAPTHPRKWSSTALLGS